MKYSLIILISVAPLLRKCAEEGAEQGVKRGGREVAVEGAGALAKNYVEIVTRVSAKSSRYFANDLNDENRNVSYIESTNTFVISNE